MLNTANTFKFEFQLSYEERVIMSEYREELSIQETIMLLEGWKSEDIAFEVEAEEFDFEFHNRV